MRRALIARPSFVPVPPVVTVSGWRWPQWLGLGVASLAITSYLHLLSWGWVETAIQALGNQPGVQSAFQGAAGGRLAALFIVFAFLLLTPIGLVAVLCVLGLIVAIAANLLSIATGRVGITESACRLAVMTALVVIAYVEKSVWVSELLWALGLVARAYLVLSE